MKTSKAIENKLKRSLVAITNSINGSLYKYILADMPKVKEPIENWYKRFENTAITYETALAETGKEVAKGFIASIEKIVNASFFAQGFDFAIKGRSEIVENTIFSSYQAMLDLIVSIPKAIINGYKQEFLNAVSDFDRQKVAHLAENIGKVNRKRAVFIARDQTHKATTNYAMARAMSLGFEYYIWDTSHDERVSTGKGGHRQLQGRIYRFDKDTAIVDSSGNKGHCGTRINCRCVPLTLIQEPSDRLELVKDADAGDYYVLKKAK